MTPTGQLPRVLGLVAATAIVVGTVIGSGVFKKAAAVSAGVPEVGLALLAWVLVGMLTLLGALTLAEVAVIVGRVGGNYAILKEAYGRWAGFLWGWVEFWIIRSGSIAALATIFTESLHDILRHIHPRGPDIDVLDFAARTGVTCAVIAALALVNARGTKWGGGLQIVITTVKIASLIGIAVLPFVVWAFVQEPRAKPNVELLRPFWPADWGQVNWVAFGGALVGVFWAYHGWMNIAPVAEEVKDPQRNIPRAVIGGVLLIIALYLSVNLAYYLVVPAPEIATIKDRTVAGVFSVRLLGPVGLLVASAAVMTSVFGALNGNLLVGPRLLYAMGQDRLAPASLARLHSRFQTPALAELVLAGWCIVQVAIVAAMTHYRVPAIEWGGYSIDLNLPAGKAPFDVITDFAMFGAISFETLSVASIFIFRRRFPPSSVALPYRCPLYPVLPAIYVLSLSAVLANMFWSQRAEALTGVGFILVGAAVYRLFFRARQ